MSYLDAAKKLTRLNPTLSEEYFEKSTGNEDIDQLWEEWTPEDVGEVGGFVNFREIMLNSSHPEHQEMKEWAGYWSFELSDWKSRPKVIWI